jgi:predicted O-methyltransferase YrrM
MLQRDEHLSSVRMARSGSRSVAARDHLSALGGRLRREHARARRLVRRWRPISMGDVRRLEAEGSSDSLRLARVLRQSIGPERDDERPVIERIERERARMEASQLQVRWKSGSTASLATIARRGSVPRRDGVLLLKLVRAFGPKRAIEMGTCVGVSAAYQASGMRLSSGGELVTLEGYADLAAQASQTWSNLDLDKVTVTVGRFDETIPGVLAAEQPDYAFVDGNHNENATMRYFEQIAARACPGALLVFDDIDWSLGMCRAWDRIRADSRSGAHAVVGRFGVVVLSAAESR